MGRFPDASENSYRKLPRSGLLAVRCGEVALELHGWQIAQGRVKTLSVIDLLEELVDGGARFCQVPVFVAMDLLVFECFHKRLAGGIVPGIRFTRHAYIDSVVFQQIRVIAAGVLGAFNRWSHTG